MDSSNTLPSFSVAFGGFFQSSTELKCPGDTTEQPMYQGKFVQTLNSPFPVYVSQSDADPNPNNTYSINPLNEYDVAPLAPAVPTDSDGLDLPVIPQAILDEYVPVNFGNESVDDALLSIPGSYSFTQQECLPGNAPMISVATPANLSNTEYQLTCLPAELSNPQPSRPVVVVNPLNMQQATNDSQVNPAEPIADDTSPQLELQKERRKDPAYAERERERRQDPEKRALRNKRQRERYIERMQDPEKRELKNKQKPEHLL